MNVQKQANGIDIVIEGGSDYNNHMVAMVATRALHDAGFTNAHRVFTPTGTSEVHRLANTDQYVPSVLDVIRKQDPSVFRTPVVMAAHDPKPFPKERRRHDRALLQADSIAEALSVSDDPDEIWANLQDGDKHRIVRELVR